MSSLYEDFSDPAFGSVEAEANLNRRLAYRRMITECRERRALRLEPVGH